MKIKYVFADGTASEVEVTDEIGTIIIDSRREEENLERKERYHSYSIEAIDYEDCDKFALTTGETPLTILLQKEDSNKLWSAFITLSKKQRERLLKLSDGMSIREIARSEKVHHKNVEESIASGRKKILKKFSKTPRQK